MNIDCPDSFAEAFNSVPDSQDKPSSYRLPCGEHVDISYVRKDGSAVTATGEWVDSETMRKAEKLG
ncbi:hypothetical protein [Marinobacter sp. BGYM27]|uniref:hypothetical protein n=1 Tax=Marinobacter sp. BGYM27 TaxID=2975597 RepID=UPI0021A62B72|nr:hypothetical protein [Marinobacter sp. BGYM27]MDG5498928.1 hypothetical protein [Marinobacter sp. BGYM27]